MRKATDFYYSEEDPEDYKDWVDALPSDNELLRLKYEEIERDLIYNDG